MSDYDKNVPWESYEEYEEMHQRNLILIPYALVGRYWRILENDLKIPQ